MSIDAITYVKTLDVDNPTSRLLLYVIAENTFNDTGLCKVGQEVLAYEVRATDRTIRTHLGKLKEGDEPVIRVHPQHLAGGARAIDHIELVGFLEWLGKARQIGRPEKSSGAKKRSRTKQPPEKSSGAETREREIDPPEKSSGGKRKNLPVATGKQLPVATGKQVSGPNKDSRTVHPVQDAPTSPSAAPDAPSDDFSSFDGQEDLAQAKAALAACNDLIPFDEQHPATNDLTGYLEGMAAVDDAVRGLATGKRRIPTPSGKCEPFTAKVLSKIGQMCIDREKLIGRYHARAAELKAAGTPIKDPSGYLYRMALGVVAQRDGVAVEIVERMYAQDAATRAQAFAEAVGVVPEQKQPRSAAWRRSNAERSNGPALAAALRGAR